MLNNLTTLPATTTMPPDFGLDLPGQNDSFNRSLDIDLSVLSDVGVIIRLLLGDSGFCNDVLMSC